MAEQWQYSLVATDKTHPYILKSNQLKKKFALYYYSIRLLLERLTWYARDNSDEKVIPIFEHRSNISYKGMSEYLSYLFKMGDKTKISWGNLSWKDYKIMPKKERLLLQASDCICGTVKDGLEHGKEYGFIEPRYILDICSHFYCRNNNLFSYGFKFLHADDTELDRLKKEYEWLAIMEAKIKSEGSHSS